MFKTIISINSPIKKVNLQRVYTFRVLKKTVIQIRIGVFS